MSDASDVHEQVRVRYAEAALSVRSGSACCGADDEAVFGATLYDPQVRGEPAGRRGAGEPGLREPHRGGRACARASGCSTSAPAAGSTSCSRRGGWGRPGSPTAST
nr:hypothetical protein [Angustibacter aerolatus]